MAEEGGKPTNGPILGGPVATAGDKENRTLEAVTMVVAPQDGRRCGVPRGADRPAGCQCLDTVTLWCGVGRLCCTVGDSYGLD